jgi:rsbT co-antagonist protein RsbR
MDETELQEEQIAEQVTDLLLAVHSLALGDSDWEIAEAVLEGPYADLARQICDIGESIESEKERIERFENELRDRIRTAKEQRETIRELSMPILEVWEGVLALPVLGVVDTMRAAEITESLLQRIVDMGATFVIIDLTGIDIMDTRTSFHFIQLVRSANLLGARCALSGIGPAVAQSVVQMGVDLSGLEIHRSMEEALFGYLGGVVHASERAARRKVQGDGHNGERTDPAARARTDGAESGLGK